jgi:hypothetical protein
MTSRFTLVFATALLFSAPVLGEDLWDPPWDPGLANQTYQAWEFSMMDPLQPFDPMPTFSENPYGYPEIVETPPVTWPDWVVGPDGVTEIATLHIDQDGPFTIWVPNNPIPNDIKLIFWQITSDRSVTPTGSGPTVTTPEGYTGTNHPAPYPQIQHQGTWYTYNGLIEVQPNPEGEWITWDLIESTNIEEIVIKTVCVIPEPSTIALMALGALTLFARKRS